MHPPTKTNLRPWHWLIITLVALGYTWFYYRPMLAGPYVLNDDMVQHYLWLFVDHYGLNCFTLRPCCSTAVFSGCGKWAN